MPSEVAVAADAGETPNAATAAAAIESAMPGGVTGDTSDVGPDV